MTLTWVRWGSASIVFGVAYAFIEHEEWIEPYGTAMSGVILAAAVVFWAAMLREDPGDDDDTGGEWPT